MSKDDLYEYGGKLVTKDEAKRILERKAEELAKNVPAPVEGRDGIDRWTNNGYGITFGEPIISKAEAEAIEKAADERQGHIKEVTYVEPASYFTEDMLKAADAWEQEQKNK